MDGRRHTLAGTLLGWGVAALCLFDAAATQLETAAAGDIEANPIGARLIQNSWACVWVLKVAAVIAFLCAVTRLLQTCWGPCPRPCRRLCHRRSSPPRLLCLIGIYLMPLAPPWGHLAKELRALQ